MTATILIVDIENSQCGNEQFELQFIVDNFVYAKSPIGSAMI